VHIGGEWDGLLDRVEWLIGRRGCLLAESGVACWVEVKLIG
jgi:hypothetical protein